MSGYTYADKARPLSEDKGHPAIHPAPTTWPTMSTAQRVTAVSGLAAMRLSTRTMAAQLETTRMAVIGFARRHKIQLAPPNVTQATRPAPPFPIEPPVPEETWAPVHGPVLAGPDCKWPSDVPCHHPRSGPAYCATHHAMAHVPTRPLYYNPHYMGQGESIVPIALEGGHAADIYGGRKGARKGCE